MPEREKSALQKAVAMASAREYPGIDYFRIIAALLVIAIHTGPFADISGEMDYYITYCVGRIGVPFFFMVTGYFVLSDYGKCGYFLRVRKTVIKLALVYLAATVFYLPINWYTGNLPDTLGGALKEILIDGTFYHLWYFPGTITGCLLTAVLLHKISPSMTGGIVLFLYVIGVLGDSWYGLAGAIPPLRTVYEGIFFITDYTRNGVFFAPVFLWMGAMLAQYHIDRRTPFVWFGAIISLFLMLIEGGITKHLSWQKHNSMYLFLIPTMLFLFEALRRVLPRSVPLAGKGSHRNRSRTIRSLTLWLYLLHPFCIVLLRALAAALHQKPLMLETSLLYYIEVCFLTLIISIPCIILRHFMRKILSQRNSAK